MVMLRCIMVADIQTALLCCWLVSYAHKYLGRVFLLYIKNDLMLLTVVGLATSVSLALRCLAS